jgi:hypothetical protein
VALLPLGQAVTELRLRKARRISLILNSSATVSLEDATNAMRRFAEKVLEKALFSHHVLA